MISRILSLVTLTGLASAYDPCYIASFPPNEHDPSVIWNLQEFGHAVGNNAKFNLVYAEGFYPAPPGFSGGITVSATNHDRVTFYNTNKPGSNDDLRIGIDPETHSTTTLIIQKPWKTNKPIESPHGGTMVFDLECPSTVEYIEFQDTEKFPYIEFFDDYGLLLNQNGQLRGPKVLKAAEKAEKGFNSFGSHSFEYFSDPPYTDVVSTIEIQLRGTAAIRSMKICPVCPH